MATIYDMATGTVISGNIDPTPQNLPEDIPTPELALQTVAHGTPIEDMTPVDAYMVLLQDLLKKL